jgi:hypothetical protein
MSDTQSVDRSPTQSLLRDLYATAGFITAHAAVLPDAPWAMDVSFKAESRGHLDELAEHFGTAVYGDDPDRHAQIGVFVPGVTGFVRIFVSWDAK